MRNDRWSTAEEIKRILVPADQNSGESGATLYYEKKKNYVQISEGHTLFLGQSGTGKSCSGTVLLAKNLIQENRIYLLSIRKVKFTVKHIQILRNLLIIRK